MTALAKLTALARKARVPWAGASLCAVSEAPAGGGREQGDRAEPAGAEGRREAQRHEGAGRRQRSGGHAARERADAGDRVRADAHAHSVGAGGRAVGARAEAGAGGGTDNKGQARGRQGDRARAQGEGCRRAKRGEGTSGRPRIASPSACLFVFVRDFLYICKI